MTDDGAPWIRAGEPDDGPPDEAYSRVTDPERYRPLHAVSDRLVEDLVARYDVVRAPVDVVGHWRGGVRRATSLRPADGDGAAIVVIITGFGLVVRAGHAYERGFPVCGCDACDEDPAELARDLTEAVDAIVSGGLTETRRRRRLGKDPFSIELRDTRGGVTRTSGTVERDEDDVIPMGTTRWAAWPERVSR